MRQLCSNCQNESRDYYTHCHTCGMRLKPLDPGEVETAVVFSNLEAAIDFIAVHLESGDFASLRASMLRSTMISRHPNVLEQEQRERQQYDDWLFPALHVAHQKYGLRNKFSGLKFPENRVEFGFDCKVDEIKTLRLDFLHTERGWVFDNISMYR